jgi:hypothetical protein
MRVQDGAPRAELPVVSLHVALHVATDRFVPHSGIELTSGVPRRRPAGLRHALRPGRRRALCGVEPALVWPALSWPAGAAEADLCLDCAAQVSLVDRGYGEVLRLPARRATAGAAEVG